MNKKVLPFILLIIVMLIFGTSFLVMKNTVNNIGSGFLIFTRGLLTFLVLLPFCFKKFKAFGLTGILISLGTGCVVGAAYLIQAIGIKDTTPGKSAFLENAYCLIVPILTCILLKKKPTIINIISVILCAAGIVFIFYQNIDSNFGIGEILSTIAGVLYGINIVLSGIYAKKYNPIAYTCVQFVSVATIGGVYSLIFELKIPFAFNKEAIFGILYLGLICTALAWALRNISQTKLSPITVSLVLPFTAVVSTLISYFFGSETIDYKFIIGGVFILIAVLLDVVKIKNKPKEKSY